MADKRGDDGTTGESGDTSTAIDGTRRRRWSDLVGFSVTRLWNRATRTRSGRIAATISAVALTIALLVVVTGVAMGLADGGVVSDDDADVWIAPEESGALSAVDGVERPRLGETNSRAATIRERDGVDHASPVLTETARLQPAGEADGASESKHVLLVGVVPDDETRTVAGLPTDALEPGDPHYADGSYDGVPRQEIVLSEAAASRLGAEAGDELELAGPGSGAGSGDGMSVAGGETTPSVTVTAVEPAGDGGSDGQDAEKAAPVALVHLSELQTASGADDGELANRVLVWGESDAAEAAATDAYPDAAVESAAELDLESLFDDGLALATSLLALLASVVICASFVATTMGMTVDQDRRTLAVLEAVGFPASSRLLVVALSTLVTTVAGAVLGAAIGIGGVHAVNAIASATVAPGAVATVHPLFVPYAVGVALLSGLLAVPYPLAVASRTSVLAEVGR
ncbi:ABC transporter permease [Halopiger aswanensis]|uniref:Putative ABC transport system permease protein n=1 Tax=Halopiger aswanensis TaxID=148449 RepID=A0A3R7HYV2_9EURY|nr:FtsX-like permease family protein [Halopiger aswanensis]RKD97099.1 putative ABC transport system permease protein [Halopiger aswanensis]